MPVDLPADTIGPVDVAVIHFEGNEFNGEVAPALADIHTSGAVRIIDLAFVRKDSAGSVAILEMGDSEVAEAFDQVEGSRFDLLSDADLEGVATGLEPDASALVVVWENSWAARLASAVRGSNGRLEALERIPRETVLRAVAALDED
ncbi:DUF6325 family protein [Janibacter sp. GS2]|uniref:DUF6325 family protein n=1 Tax=Janibacter sp. GS2 TaxID=3442646 RepID=UPI003EB6A41B